MLFGVCLRFGVFVLVFVRVVIWFWGSLGFLLVLCWCLICCVALFLVASCLGAFVCCDGGSFLAVFVYCGAAWWALWFCEWLGWLIVLVSLGSIELD